MSDTYSLLVLFNNGPPALPLMTAMVHGSIDWCQQKVLLIYFAVSAATSTGGATWPLSTVWHLLVGFVKFVEFVECSTWQVKTLNSADDGID